MDGLGQIDFRSAGREALVDLARSGMRSLVPGPFGGAAGALASPVAGFLFDQLAGKKSKPASLTNDLDTPSELKAMFGSGFVDKPGTHKTPAGKKGPNAGIQAALQALQSFSQPQTDPMLEQLMARGVTSGVAPMSPRPSIILPQTRPLTSFIG